MIANYSDRGRTTILTILSYLKDLQCIRSSEFLLQMFADAKLSEIVSIATKANQEERKKIVPITLKSLSDYVRQI